MKTVRKMFDHMQWANTRLIEGLKAKSGDDGKALRLFAHLVRAEQIWITRLQGNDSSHLDLWAEMELAACSELAAQNIESYTAYLNTLTEDRLDEVITYKNQSGKEFQTSIRDILTHVALHGQYHRGQINALLRSGGDEPVAVDYILFVR